MPSAPRLEVRGEMDARNRNQVPIGIDGEHRTSLTAPFAARPAIATGRRKEQPPSLRGSAFGPNVHERQVQGGAVSEWPNGGNPNRGRGLRQDDTPSPLSRGLENAKTKRENDDDHDGDGSGRGEDSDRGDNEDQSGAGDHGDGSGANESGKGGVEVQVADDGEGEKEGEEETSGTGSAADQGKSNRGGDAGAKVVDTTSTGEQSGAGLPMENVLDEVPGVEQEETAKEDEEKDQDSEGGNDAIVAAWTESPAGIPQANITQFKGSSAPADLGGETVTIGQGGEGEGAPEEDGDAKGLDETEVSGEATSAPVDDAGEGSAEQSNGDAEEGGDERFGGEAREEGAEGGAESGDEGGDSAPAVPPTEPPAIPSGNVTPADGDSTGNVDNIEEGTGHGEVERGSRKAEPAKEDSAKDGQPTVAPTSAAVDQEGEGGRGSAEGGDGKDGGAGDGRFGWGAGQEGAVVGSEPGGERSDSIPTAPSTTPPVVLQGNATLLEGDRTSDVEILDEGEGGGELEQAEEGGEGGGSDGDGKAEPAKEDSVSNEQPTVAPTSAAVDQEGEGGRGSAEGGDGKDGEVGDAKFRSGAGQEGTVFGSEPGGERSDSIPTTPSTAPPAILQGNATLVEGDRTGNVEILDEGAGGGEVKQDGEDGEGGGWEWGGKAESAKEEPAGDKQPTVAATSAPVEDEEGAGSAVEDEGSASDNGSNGQEGGEEDENTGVGVEEDGQGDEPAPVAVVTSPPVIPQVNDTFVEGNGTVKAEILEEGGGGVEAQQEEGDKGEGDEGGRWAWGGKAESNRDGPAGDEQSAVATAQATSAPVDQEGGSAQGDTGNSEEGEEQITGTGTDEGGEGGESIPPRSVTEPPVIPQGNGTVIDSNSTAKADILQEGEDVVVVEQGQEEGGGGGWAWGGDAKSAQETEVATEQPSTVTTLAPVDGEGGDRLTRAGEKGRTLEAEVLHRGARRNLETARAAVVVQEMTLSLLCWSLTLPQTQW